MSESELVQRMFAEYYASSSRDIAPPSQMPQREFGFLLFKEKVMLRHKSFREAEEMRRLIAATVPSDVYYSSAYYQYPCEAMDRKGWLGADLVFDIDSDHIDTPCKRDHYYWFCEECGGLGKGVKPGVCPNCGGRRVRADTWLCEKCLEAAKAETLKLLDFLVSDFGLQPDEISTCFSGQRGYHIHVEDEEVRSLSQSARKEIADYVTGTGLSVKLHGIIEPGVKGGLVLLPELQEPGWRGRIARGIYDLLSERNNKLQLRRGANFSEEIKDYVLKSLTGEKRRASIKGVGPKTWAKLAELGAKRQASSIDVVVTTDIHRLIRLPGTLHGKTGFKAVEVPTKALERFDPLRDALAFRGVMDVFVQYAPKFRIGDEVYGPYKREKVTLPAAAAIYLICKGVASQKIKTVNT
jgi:DNA primase small subunit